MELLDDHIRFLVREALKVHDAVPKLTILYLQGYHDTTTEPIVKILKDTKNLKVIAPKIDYDNGSVWNKLSELIEKHKVTAIIGHSLGGYIGYYLSQKFYVPALLFSPAFEDKWYKLQPVPENILYLPIKKYDKIVVMGAKDDELNIKNIEKLLIGKSMVYEEPEMNHQPNEEIFKKYLELFVGKYLI